jgi:hypothetical protein
LIRAHLGFAPMSVPPPSPLNPKIMPSCAIITATMIRVRHPVKIA